jgi:vancomycin resistance protein VanJ
VLLFGPRWLLLVPALPLALAAMLIRPRLLLPVLAGLALVIGPVMGWRLGWRRWFPGDQPERLRIVTFNVDGNANPRATEVAAELRKLEPDVMVFQECPEAVQPSGPGWRGWTFRHDRSLCLLTRFPVDSVLSAGTVETRSEGMTGMALLYMLRTSGGILRLGNVHLETPRKGLEPLRGEGEVGSLVRNIMLRDVGSRRVSRWLTGQRADLVAGDFNLTVESAIYRRYWSDCPDAFSRVGRGFGWTRVLLRFAARIDHVLACGGWKPVSARVGPDLGSDHLPLVVDLAPDRGQ